MKKILLLSLLAIPALARAEVVQHEVFGAYTNSDYDDVYTLGYTHYLEAMQTDGAIKEELPFLSRAGYVRGFLASSDGDNALQLDGRFFLQRDLFLGAGYSFDTDHTSDGTLSLYGGNYFSENSAYQVTVNRDFWSDVTGVDLGTRTVTGLDGTASLAYGVGVGAGDISDMGDTFSVRGDITYYFTDYTGLGLDLIYYEAADFVSYQFEFSHYFTETVGVILAAGEPVENNEQVTLAVRARF